MQSPSSGSGASFFGLVLATSLACTGLASTGCGKVQSLLGKGDAGESSGGSGGGLFGALKKDEGLSFLSAFEGQIDLVAKGKVGGARQGTPTAGGDVTNLSLLVKDKRFRIDVPETTGPTGQRVEGFGVLDGPQKKAFFVMDTPEKMALVFDLNKTGEQLKTLSPSGTKSFGATPKETKPPPKVTKTGKKDKVAGYDCEDWQIESDDGSKASLCVAQQGFSWLQIPMMGAPAEYAWAGELLDGTHFPLRFIVFERDGKEGGRVEVTKIEKKALAANLFEVPPGYPQLTLEQMIAKMMAGMGAGRGLPPGVLTAPPKSPKPPR